MPTVLESDFSNYNLEDITVEPRGVYELAGRVIPDIAQAFDINLGATPSTAEIKALINIVGSSKELQDNITGVRERVGTELSGLALAATLTERSGVLRPVARNFVSPEIVIPKKIDSVIVTGGVARWILRRREVIADDLTRYSDSRIHVMTGSRVMKETEHTSVEALMKKSGGEITETDFASEYVARYLSNLGMNVVHTKVGSGVGNEVFAEGISEHPEILDGSVLVVGNAPAAVMTTGQFLSAASNEDPLFNSTTEQLFMAGDGIDVARTEEESKSPATHQNPYTALGQIARNALYLEQTAAAMRNQS